MEEKNGERSFVAGKTYRNLSLVTIGFLLYTGYVLDQEDGPKYVPALHSNQSSLEAFFSHVRALNRDTASKYGMAVISHNAIKTVRSYNVLKNNKMYAMEDIIPEENTAKPLTIVGGKMKMRQAKYESWVCLRSKKQIDGGLPVRLFPEATVVRSRQESDVDVSVKQMIISKVLDQSHFSSFFNSDTVFQELAASSIDSVSEMKERQCEVRPVIGL